MKNNILSGKKYLLIHGYSDYAEYINYKDSLSNAHWFPWLQREIVRKEGQCQALEMPRPYEPIYEDWARLFSQFELDKNTYLIGYSCGGGFLVRYLSENDVKVGGIYLVAPWLDPEKMLGTGFFQFNLDKDMYTKTDFIKVIYSDNDDRSIDVSVKILKDGLDNNESGKVDFILFKNKGHFCEGDLNGREFPELLESILSEN